MARPIELQQFAIRKSPYGRNGSILIIGDVDKSPPLVNGCGWSYAEATRSKPWVASIQVPERFRKEVSKQIKRGEHALRLGPFRTKTEGLIALENWWLARLGR